MFAFMFSNVLGQLVPRVSTIFPDISKRPTKTATKRFCNAGCVAITERLLKSSFYGISSLFGGIMVICSVICKWVNRTVGYLVSYDS